MDHSPGAKRRKLTPIESEKSSPTSSTTTDKSMEISTHDSPISHLPQELLTTIIDYIPKTQWPSLELMNRSFRDAVYSSWQSVKEFNIDKDVLDIRQKAAARFLLLSFLPSILAKLQLRSPMLQSIMGFPPIYRNSAGAIDRYRSEILHIISQFTNLERIDFGVFGLASAELVEFLTSSANRDRLLEINSFTYLRTNEEWPASFTAQETSESQASRLKLQKLSLKNENRDIFLDPRIIDLINPASLTVLVLDKIAAPSDYLLSLITNCNQLQQLQFSFLASCRCGKWPPCVHSISNKRILDAITALENLDSLKICLIDNWNLFGSELYIDIRENLPRMIDRLGRRGRLVEFGLLHDYYCSFDVIEGIGDHLAALKSVQVFCCYPPTLVRMIKKMVSLEKLAFSLTNSNGVSKVFETMAKHLQNLTSFHLRFPKIDIECLHLLTRFNRLEELSIVDAFCHNVEWKSAFGHQLKSLELRNCHEEFVASCLKQVPGLRRLGISGYMGLDNVLNMIPTTCPGLREISVSSSLGYTKEGVQAIVDGCPELEQLRC